MNKNRKVLFIDDDELLAETNIFILESRGYECKYLPSTQKVIQTVEQYQPDIIILDMEIDTIHSGIDIASKLKKDHPDIPILFISSHTAGKDVRNALQAGGDSYVKKPFDNEELLAYIEKLMPPSKRKNIGKYYQLELETHKLYFKKELLVKRLSSKEYNLLLFFCSNPGKILERELIIRTCWPKLEDSGMSLNNFIHTLRSLLSKDRSIVIETVTSKGYRMIIKETEL